MGAAGAGARAAVVPLRAWWDCARVRAELRTPAALTSAAGTAVLGVRLAILGDGGRILKDVALGLWVLTMLWLPVLVAAELLRPRLRYDVRRWSTVFPFGM